MAHRFVAGLVVGPACALACIVMAACSEDADGCGPVVEVRAEQLSFPTADICAMVAGSKSCAELCGSPFNRCDVTGQNDNGSLPFACPGTATEKALVHCRQFGNPDRNCDAP